MEEKESAKQDDRTIGGMRGEAVDEKITDEEKKKITDRLNRYIGAVIGAVIGDMFGQQTSQMNSSMTDSFKFDPSNPEISYRSKLIFSTIDAFAYPSDNDVACLNPSKFAQNLMKITGTIDPYITTIINLPHYTRDPHSAVVRFEKENKCNISHNNLILLGIIAFAKPSFDTNGAVSDVIKMMRCLTNEQKTSITSIIILSIIGGLIAGMNTEDSIKEALGGLTKKSSDIIQKDVAEAQKASKGSINDLGLNTITNNTIIALKCAFFCLRVIESADKANKSPKFNELLTAVAKKCGNSCVNCSVTGAILGAYLGFDVIFDEYADCIPDGLVKDLKQVFYMQVL